MADEEKFAKIRLDEKNGDHVAPSFYYWGGTVRFNPEQKQFFAYFKDCIERGERPKARGCEPYVKFYANDLRTRGLKTQKLESTPLFKKLLAFLELYPEYEHYVDDVFKELVEQRRAERLAADKRSGSVARWIEPGEGVESGGLQLRRGGFYLGTHLRCSPFDTKAMQYSKVSRFYEGPVVDLESQYAPDKYDYMLPPSTYLELNDVHKEGLLHWLEGGDLPSTTVLAYYISGYEFRLLCDPETSRESRIAALRALLSLAEELAKQPLASDVSSSRLLWSLRERIFSLIDFTLTRFFIDDAESVLPGAFTSELRLLQRSRLLKKLEGMDLARASAEEIAEEVAHGVVPPQGLPSVYADAFMQEFKRYFISNYRYRPWEMWGESDEKYYRAASAGHFYAPVSGLAEAIEGKPFGYNKTSERMFKKIKNAYTYVMSEVQHFVELCKSHFGPLALISELPPWCKIELLPGIEAAKAKLLPAEGEPFRLVRVADIVADMGLSTDVDQVFPFDTERMEDVLKRLGLRIGWSINTFPTLRIDDTIALYRDQYDEVPTRGTLGISLYLVAWMAQANGASARDLAIIDQWIAGYDPKANWAVPAQAVVRWLAQRKLTMTQKRKVKAAALAKFPKRRDELLRLLLQLVSDAEAASPKRMKRLETIYTVIGLDPADIHSDLHRMATAPAPRPQGAKKTAAAAIDRAKLAQMARNTAKAQEILSDVFSQEAEQPAAQPAAKKAAGPAAKILAALAEREEWSRADFEALCKAEGETAGAALEKLNDLAYDKLDEPVADDEGDTIHVDTQIARELLDQHL